MSSSGSIRPVISPTAWSAPMPRSPCRALELAGAEAVQERAAHDLRLREALEAQVADGLDLAGDLRQGVDADPGQLVGVERLVIGVSAAARGSGEPSGPASASAPPTRQQDQHRVARGAPCRRSLVPSMTGAMFTQPMPEFKLNPAYTPTADQPKAIEAIAEGLGSRRGVPHAARRDRHREDVHDGRGDRAGPAPGAGDRPQQDPGGAALQRVPRVLPRQRVEYFVTYYDYYQPEAYVPRAGPLHREGLVDQRRDRPPAPCRHRRAAGAARRVIVASVSCIFGIGSPELYRRQMQLFKVGEWIDRDELFRKLVGMQYTRNETALTRGTFRVEGRDARDLPRLRRVGLPDQPVRRRGRVDPPLRPAHRRGLDEIDHVAVWPAEPLRDRGGDPRARRASRSRTSSTSASPGFTSAARSSRRTASSSAPSTTSRC